MTDEIDTSASRVERAAINLDVLGGRKTSALLRALRAERDAERARAEKADEYHAIANAYAEWAGDILELLEERTEELDPDSPSDERLRILMDRAEAGIAAETRRALRQDEGGE